MDKIQKQKNRLDKFDRKLDKKISVLGKEQEEKLTQIYSKNVNDLMWLTEKLQSEKAKDKVKDNILEAYKKIDQNNIGLAESQKQFGSAVLRWQIKVEERLGVEKTTREELKHKKERAEERMRKLTEEDEKPDEVQTNINKAQATVENLKEFKETVTDDPDLEERIDEVIEMLTDAIRTVKKSAEIKNQIHLKLKEKAGRAFIRYSVLSKELETYEKSEEISKQVAETRETTSHAADIKLEIKTIDKYIGELKELQKTFDLSGGLEDLLMSPKEDEIPSMEFDKKSLQVLADSGGYFKATNTFFERTSDAEKIKALTYEEILEEYRVLEGLGPVVEGNPTLTKDLRTVLEGAREELVGRKTMEIKDEIIEELDGEIIEIFKWGDGNFEYSVVDDAETYFTFIETDEGLQILPKPSFMNLKMEDQMLVRSVLAKLNTKITLKQEEALLETEDRECMKRFYEANQSLSKGDYLEAKNLYKEFFRTYEVDPWMKEDPSESEEVLRARENLKLIAEYEISMASDQLNSMEKSIAVYRSYFVDSQAVHDFGTNKEIAGHMIGSQRVVLNLAKELINADNNIVTLEDAVEAVGGMTKLDLPQMIGYLKSLGLTYTDATQAKYTYGNWYKDGIAFYFSEFGTHFEDGDYIHSLEGQKYLRSFDAIQSTIEQRGDLTQDEILEKAREYKEVGLYELSEKMYDLYFKDVYQKNATNELTFEAYRMRFEKNPGQRKEADKQIKQFADMYEEEGKIISPDEKAAMRANIIKDAWKKDIQRRISIGQKKGRMTGKMGRVWHEYNDDILEADRDWYELHKFTCQEWDRFVEEMPLEIMSIIATAGGAGWIGKKVTQKIAGKIVLKQLAKLGLKKAFEKGGMKLAMRQLSKIGFKKIAEAIGKKEAMQIAKAQFMGFIVEAAAFSELGMLSHALRSKDLSALVSPTAHLEGFGHSVLTLGTLRAVNLPLKGLEKLEGLGGALARAGITTVADTAALTGQQLALGKIAGTSMEDRDIAALIRQNAALSIGIRIGHGALNMPGKVRKNLGLGPSVRERLISSKEVLDAELLKNSLNMGLGKPLEALWKAGKELVNGGRGKKLKLNKPQTFPIEDGLLIPVEGIPILCYESRGVLRVDIKGFTGTAKETDIVLGTGDSTVIGGELLSNVSGKDFRNSVPPQDIRITYKGKGQIEVTKLSKTEFPTAVMKNEAYVEYKYGEQLDPFTKYEFSTKKGEIEIDLGERHQVTCYGTEKGTVTVKVGENRWYKLKKGQKVTIGRKDAQKVTGVEDMKISSKHVTIENIGKGKFTVMDRESGNKTTIEVGDLLERYRGKAEQPKFTEKIFREMKFKQKGKEK